MSNHGTVMTGIRFSGTVCNLADRFLDKDEEQRELLMGQVAAGNPQLLQDLKLMFLRAVSIVLSFRLYSRNSQYA